MTREISVYAGALYDLAEAEDVLDAVHEGLRLAAQTVGQNAAYRKLLENPAVLKSERLALLDETLKGAVHPYVLSFCKILCEQRLLAGLSACESAYRARLYEQRGILPVTAASAVPLSEAQLDALRRALEKKTGKTILLTNTADESLIGGVSLRYAGTELDGTAKGRLGALRALLTQSTTEGR